MSYSSINTVTVFFGLLALVAIAIAVGVAVSFLTRDRFGLIERLRPLAVELAAAVATTSMLGSLFMSEVAGYEPCLNCWIQRAFMYPAAFLLIAAAVTGRSTLVKVAGILSVLGICVSIFHRYEQAVGSEIGGFCDAAAPCSTVYVRVFGFLTIPTMAGAGFAAVIALAAVHLTGAGREMAADEPLEMSVG